MEESIRELLEALAQYVEILAQNQSQAYIDFLAAIIPTVGTIVVAVAGVVGNYYVVSRNSEDSSNKRKIHKYTKCLEEFYYPLTHLIGISTNLYSCFALREKEQDSEYRTLLYLIRKYEYSDTDRKILAEIIACDCKAGELIQEKSWYVDNHPLKQKLTQLATYYTLMKLAYDGKIEEENQKFKEFVFPEDIQECIWEEIERIEGEIKRLRK